jgi:iron complex outermembrane receptor protein
MAARIRRGALCAVFCIALLVPLAAQDAAVAGEAAADEAAELPAGEVMAGEVVELPAAEVVEEFINPNSVSREQMDREGSLDLWEALRNVPGVIRSSGSDDGGEGFRVRGFDSSRMPVFIDGVPFESPYKGDADYSRLLTADIEEVEVQKGFSSMLLGPNTMGGAILLQTAKPKAPLEAGYETSLDADSRFNYSGSLNTLYAGSKQERFYAKGTAQFRAIDHWLLPDSFVPSYDSPQKKGERLYSDSRDIKATLLGGWTPSGNFSLNGSYTLLDADKGRSPPEVNKPAAAAYDWPLWRRHTATLDAAYEGAFLDRPLYGKGLFYFDKFDTRLIRTAAYTQDIENDDYILGGRLEGGLDLNGWNNIKAALNLKQEAHRRRDNSAQALTITENTFSGGAEYEMLLPLRFRRSLDSSLRLSAGLGFDILQPLEFWAARDMSRTSLRYMFSWQAGAFLDITPKHTLRFTYAKKNHIPSMWQRYEQIYGDVWDDSVPNPDLKNETAYHYELGYRGMSPPNALNMSLALDAAIYYADLYDMIAEGDIATSTGGTTSMRVNIDKTAYYGFELGLTLYLCKWVSAGGAFSANRYEIKEGASGYHIEGNFPRSTASAYVILTPFASLAPRPLQTLALTPAYEYEGPRYSRFTRLGTGAVIGRYHLVSLKLTSELDDHFSFSAGIDNLLDAQYSLDSAYLPMPGRSFNFRLAVRY